MLCSETFCSHPSRACVQKTTTSVSDGLNQTYAFGSVLNMPTPNVTCLGNSTLRLNGLVADPGMSFEVLGTVVVPSGGSASCKSVPNLDTSGNAVNATITVTNTPSAYIVWVGGTNYDLSAGDAAHNFTFRGPDPHQELQTILSNAVRQSYEEQLATHKADYQATLHKEFSLDLGQKPNLMSPTNEIKANYAIDKGNAYLEWVAFNFGRHLLASSARGLLPTNLQGKWARDADSPWGADYRKIYPIFFQFCLD